MNILFISRNGNSLGLAERIQQEGHTSIFFVADARSKMIGDGMIPKPEFDARLTKLSGYPIAGNIDSLLAETKPDFAVFDSISLGRVADYIKSKNIPVLGGCLWADATESDLSYARKMMRQVSIEPLPINILGEDIVKVGCEMWWNGLEPLVSSILFEEKHFMNNDLGSVCEWSGVVLRTLPSTSRLIQCGIEKMVRLLKKTIYRGPITLYSYITSSSLYGLDFKVSLTHFSSLFEIYKGPITKFLYTVATGGHDFGDFTTDYAVGLKLSIPPYPLSSVDPVAGTPVLGVGPSNLKHIWWHDIKRGEETYESAGSTGNLLTVVARGRDVGECTRRVYRTASNLSIKDLQYRTDIGSKVNLSERKLERWNYI